jgi:transcriptional regulator with XRE-family HTH domain
MTKRRAAGGSRGRKTTKPTGEHHRLMVNSIEDRLASPHLERLAKNLVAHLEASGMTKPEFAESIGMSGSQFRYVRSRAANPSIEMLARISAKLKTPLYELLEDCQLGHRRNLSAKQMTKHLSLVVKRKYADSGLAKEQFAKVIGVSLPQLYLMLRGESNPSLLIVIEIARRLGIGMWELLGIEPVGLEERAGR